MYREGFRAPYLEKEADLWEVIAIRKIKSKIEMAKMKAVTVMSASDCWGEWSNDNVLCLSDDEEERLFESQIS